MKTIFKRIDPDSIKSRRIIFLTGIAFYFGLFYFIQNFNNSAFLYGDEWEYQSMAVNFAKGYGLQIHGCLTNFDDYKFLEGSNDYVADFTKQNAYDFYRTPLYPFLVGVIYKIFGVNPIIVKIIQLLLIIIVGAYLPLLAYRFWGKAGFLSGILSTPIFISLNYKFAQSILTEPLIIFIIFLIILAFQYHQYKNDLKSATLLGFILAMSWLTKGILMPLTLIIFICCFWKYYRTKNRQFLLNTTVIGMVFIMSILPYTIYVNSHSKEFILISNQGKTILLDSHNEFVQHGFWGWQRQTDPKSFYLNDHMQNTPVLKRILNFYVHYPNLIFKLINEKIVSGFLVLSFVWLFIFSYIADHIMLIIKRLTNKRGVINSYGLLSILLIIFGFILVTSKLEGQLYNLNNNAYFWLDQLNKISVPLFILLFGLFILNYKKEKTIQIPLVVAAIIFNFVFMVTVTCVPILQTRFVKVIDFVFILVSVHYLITYCIKIFESLKKQPDAI